MKKNLKRIFSKSYTIRQIFFFLQNVKYSWGGVVENHGVIRIKRYVKGNNNKIVIGRNTCLNGASFRIVGNNNIIEFGENVNIGKGCSFWAEGNNIRIYVGNHTTFTHKVHVNAQEDNSQILIGDDCMFSNTIIIRTSDSHPIYNSDNIRINPAKSINIGEHVWIAPNTKIMKGVTIGSGSIIGSDTIVTKDLPSNILAVGHPAKIVKTDVRWTRESIF
jgi:acetyltransferase-like isoleucine patch superfamily enzyme